MRQWLYVLIPAAAILYIALNPGQFIRLINWFQGVLQ
jgi:hypothetical protein